MLYVYTCPSKVIFSSIRDDIVFWARKHLYKISYRNCKDMFFCFLKNGHKKVFFSDLPPKYRAKIMSDKLVELEDEILVSENEELENLLLYPVCSIPFGGIDISDHEKPSLDVLLKEQTCEKLEERDKGKKNSSSFHVYQFRKNCFNSIFQK